MANQFGVMSKEASGVKELRATQALHQYLKDAKLYESEEEAAQRQQVLGRLDQVVKGWIKLAARANGQSESVAQDANASIFTFGSYRLGVHAPGADIDVLCVGPTWAARERYFFGEESYCLEQVLKLTPGVTDVTPVPKAYVPVLQIKYYGFELDVLYAQLGLFIVPDKLDLVPNSILRGCDEQSARSLNGCRVTDTILKSVPNVETFRLALKAVKLWADKRGIYSNVSGYLGGVNMALLVARVCKWYPNKCAADILLSLFNLISKWEWPNALHLLPQQNDPNMTLPVYDPNSHRDSAAVMPIITPVYPAMNSTYNVTRCTMEVMLAELKHAFTVCLKIIHKPGPVDWSMLFQQHAFFESKTAFYVLIELFANNDSDLERWDGWVRSRIRLLVGRLEDHMNVRPYPKSLNAPQDLNPGDARPRKTYFLCLTKRPEGAAPVNNANTYQRNAGATTALGQANKSINITQPISQFKAQVLEWAERRDGMDLRPKVMRQRDLPTWVFPDGVNPLLQAAQPANTAASTATANGAPAAATAATSGSAAVAAGASASSHGVASEATGTGAQPTGSLRQTSSGQVPDLTMDESIVQGRSGSDAGASAAPRQGSPTATEQGATEAQILASGQGEISEYMGDPAVHLANTDSAAPAAGSAADGAAKAKGVPAAGSAAVSAASSGTAGAASSAAASAAVSSSNKGAAPKQTGAKRPAEPAAPPPKRPGLTFVFNS